MFLTQGPSASCGQMLPGATVSGGLTGARGYTFMLAQSHIWLATSCWQMVGGLCSSLQGAPIGTAYVSSWHEPWFPPRAAGPERKQRSHSALLKAIAVEW